MPLSQFPSQWAILRHLTVHLNPRTRPFQSTIPCVGASRRALYLAPTMAASTMDDRSRNPTDLQPEADAPVGLPEPESPRRGLAGVLSEGFIAWLGQIRELITYIDDRRRDFDGILMERLRRHYESYAPTTPKPKKHKRKRTRTQVMWVTGYLYFFV